MKKHLGYTIVELMVALTMLVLIPAGIYGWIENIIKIMHGSFDPLTGIMVLRCIGIFVAPLGVILGYC